MSRLTYKGDKDSTFDKFDETNYNVDCFENSGMHYNFYNLAIGNFESIDSDLRNSEFNYLLDSPHRFIEIWMDTRTDRVFDIKVVKELSDEDLHSDEYLWITIPDKTPRKFLNWARETFRPIFVGDIQQNYQTKVPINLKMLFPLLGAFTALDTCYNTTGRVRLSNGVFFRDMSKSRILKEISRVDYTMLFPGVLEIFERELKWFEFRRSTIDDIMTELKRPHTIPEEMVIDVKSPEFYYNQFKELVNG